MGQLRRPVEIDWRERALRGLAAQRACHRNQPERIVERAARIGDSAWRGCDSIACPGVDRVAPYRRMRSEPRHGRGPGRCRRRALTVRTRQRCSGRVRHAGRCPRTKRRRTTRDGGIGRRRCGRCRDGLGHLVLRWRARRRTRLNRGDPHGVGRRRSVIRYAACRLNRVGRRELHRLFMCGNQPADDAERADAPADRVPCTPVAKTAGGMAGVPIRSGRQYNRRSDVSRGRRGDGQRLPVARAVRSVYVDAGRRQCRDAVLAGLRAGCVAKDPVAAERRHAIERSDAWEGEHACNGDEVRWGHRAVRHATRATVPVRRGTVVANRDIVVSRRRPVDQINPIFASVSGRLVLGEL